MEALKEDRDKQVKYTEYPNAGHVSWEKTYKEVTDNNRPVD